MPLNMNNPLSRDVLPKVCAKGNLDPTNLGGLIDLVGNIALGDAKARSADMLGHVFEYFLGNFALAEVKNDSHKALKSLFFLMQKARLNVLIAESSWKVKMV